MDSSIEDATKTGFRSSHSTMTVKQLMIFPVKGMRGCSVNEAVITPLGFGNDRRFIVCRKLGDGSFKGLGAADPLEMNRFAVELHTVEDCGGNTAHPGFRIRYTIPKERRRPQATGLRELFMIPFEPATPELLKTVHVVWNGTGTDCLDMGEMYNEYFSECLGFECVLIYLGEGSRAVENPGIRFPHLEVAPRVIAPPKASLSDKFRLWTASMHSFVTFSLPSKRITHNETPIAIMAAEVTTQAVTGFADSGPLLVVNNSSVEACNFLLGANAQVNVEKFRPNIVVTDHDTPAWDEDNWRSLYIFPNSQGRREAPEQPFPVTIQLGGNCTRCCAINVDYETGKESTGPNGQLFKKLQKDRRIDVKMPHVPVFGRYGYPIIFPSSVNSPETIRVGDKVIVYSTSKSEICQKDQVLAEIIPGPRSLQVDSSDSHHAS